ncbi:MAG: VOC family protein [Brevibacterium sp.]|nr:VOC family protein [Brevibacterium sp.]MDN5876051.1 VOC family protein [Brevibacterium sp.]
MRDPDRDRPLLLVADVRAGCEECGWLKDRYGISRQIVPANLGEPTTGDAQLKALMRMKKISIEQLVNAG